MGGGYLRGWNPLEKVEVPEVRLRVMEAMGAENVECWVNDRYQVLVRIQKPEGKPEMRHLSIHLHDRSPMRNWRHLQQIKNEVCGELWTGIEFFPREDKLTDTSNQYHLFCFPPEVDFGFGLAEEGESLVSDDEFVAAWNAAPHPGMQEPWEPGLTTGRTEHSRPARERLREVATTESSQGKDSTP